LLGFECIIYELSSLPIFQLLYGIPRIYFSPLTIPEAISIELSACGVLFFGRRFCLKAKLVAKTAADYRPGQERTSNNYLASWGGEAGF